MRSLRELSHRRLSMARGWEELDESLPMAGTGFGTDSSPRITRLFLDAQNVQDEGVIESQLPQSLIASGHTSVARTHLGL